jgi:protein-L-isoaspartate(D-aspartate) O-methyltransferase
MSRSSDEEAYARLRHRMVHEQLRARGIADKRVLEAMGRVPRHRFVPPGLREMAYSDGPLPIGENQTISQPYVVAAMTEALAVAPGDRVLEVGTGSGYQAAVLAEMGVQVFTIEYVDKLAATARQMLERLDYMGLHFRVGDGRMGWPEESPFNGIIVTAAPDSLPQSLTSQLVTNGNLVIPVGRWDQDLYVYTRQANGTLAYRRLFAVRFVPLL